MTEREIQKLCKRFFICDQKKPDCDKRWCGEGFCYHTMDKKHAKYDQPRKWINLKSPPHTKGCYVEICRTCTHPEIEYCHFRQYEINDPIKTKELDNKTSGCIRRRCVHNDRTRRKGQGLAQS